MKIIYLTSRFPYPINKGDKLRSYHQIKELSKSHEIHLISLSEKSISEKNIWALNKYCKSITIYKMVFLKRIFNLFKTLFNNKPFQVNYFYHYSIQKKLNNKIDGISPDYIFCQLIRTAMYVKNNHTTAKVLDYMDSLSKGMERRIKISNLFIKPFVIMEFQRLKRFENLAFEFFNKHIIISENDRKEIAHNKKDEIEIIGNGIDTNYFQKIDTEIKYELVFIGNLSYLPNIEAANFIAKKVLPKLLEKLPRIKILIAGSNPSKRVLKLANKNIEIQGWVEDIRKTYSSGKIFFAPMTIGSGLQNKLLEAMSTSIPCITSELSNRSLKAVEKKNILIGRSVNEYVNHITLLLNDEKKRKKIGESGRKYVIKNYNWKTSNDKLLRLLKSKQNF
jgi:glycosyltransferase involved in cell wall biosynthesis